MGTECPANGPDYHLSSDDDMVHFTWDNDHDPILTVEPGDVVHFSCRDAADGQLGYDSSSEDVPEIDLDRTNPLTGPVAVDGAEPGDALVVEVLDCQCADWGFTGVWPGSDGVGLLPDAFPNPALHIWSLDGEVGTFVDDIEVPLDPFPGVMGVAPAEDGEHDPIPPRSVGGNMDLKHLTAGSTLYLPVAVKNALFSVGDGHAAQGDGEVCVGAIETPIEVTLRFDVRKDIAIEYPQFRTSGPFAPSRSSGFAYAASGVSDTLMGAAKIAVGQLIEHLHDQRGLTHEDAYILCSVAADLKINEIVDAPNWVVSAYIAEELFPESGE